MLSSLQIERVLKQCEKIHAAYGDVANTSGPIELQWDWARNQGWCEALRLVLECDTKSIRNTPLTIDDFIDKEGKDE